MSSLISKRQQARNEKALQDLVQSVAGNNVCADCGVRNPSWASWNLGIFLCMRCAAIHRKLGTHISKVKSLSMDSWTNEQVDSMKKTGNAASNAKWNPKNKKPPVPIDADEADGAMERFVRAKYAQPSSPVGGTRRNGAGNRSDESDEGTPPPLPPKTGGRFGFTKSNSSTFPISFRSSSKKESRSGPSSPHDFPPERSPNHLSNKPSKVFGANVGSETPEATAAKLTQLRDMGFTDDKRNAMILKGVNGSVEKTIEALVRLGEGSGHGTVPPRVPSRESSLPAPRTLTPQRSFDVSVVGAKKSVSSPSATINNNPWDIQPAQPQSSQSTGTIPNNNSNPFYTTNTVVVDNNDPFGLGAYGGGQQDLTQSMQNLGLAPPAQQALFPHHTGGVPGPQAMMQQQQQPMTPPTSQMQNNYPGLATQQGYNPFLQAPASQQQQAQSLSLNTMPFRTHSQSQPQSPASHAGNPFLRSPASLASPLNQIPEQSQQNTYNTAPQSPYGNNPFMAAGGTSQFVQSSANMQQQNPFQASQQAQNPFQPSTQTQQNPFQATMQQQQSPWQTQGVPQQQQQQNPYLAQQNYYQPQQQQQQQQSSPFAQSHFPGPYQSQVDKASIMALYGSANPSPSPFSPQNSQEQQQQQLAVQQTAAPQRSVSMPLPTASAQSSNPFMGGGLAAKAGLASPSAIGAPAVAPTTAMPASIATGGARSRESMMVEMGWANGRHSPDAFASFSARS
ncbi:hypothetical protein Micbo1qcDRAFT_195768 [Microdochium bolleyi]|uniref:Arf-GAP domain-containing protein n=1 Tax=Microdochium bolleyi TaxID=196109 RepID=A0A136J1H6_9PEZI|nr:hypothetical protein Micbo1qcDRAFT_195768 [Microdochium bolleyi]